MRIPFYKYQATGNDFIIINQMLIPYFQNPSKDLIEGLCDRKFGIGADGLMILEKSTTTDFRMIYFNADGNESTMCGNGGRAISHLAQSVKVFDKEAQFEAIDGLHKVIVNPNDQVALQMINVDDIKHFEDSFELNTGSPHYVQRINDLLNQDVFTLGQKIRYSDLYREEGINVNFMERDKKVLHVRTYERGVEDETLSCGTGVTAAAIVATHLYEDWNTAAVIPVKTKGGMLKVRFQKEGDLFRDVWLEGPALKVFEGTISL